MVGVFLCGFGGSLGSGGRDRRLSLCCCCSRCNDGGAERSAPLLAWTPSASLSVPNSVSSNNIRSSPFLISVVAGGQFVRFVYQLAKKSGWFSCTTAYGGFLSLCVHPRESGLLMIEVLDPLQTSNVMATGHLG